MADVQRTGLTETELEILRRAASGETYRAIATALYLSPATIAYYATRLQRQLHVPSMAAAVALGFIGGLLSMDTWPVAITGLAQIDFDSLPSDGIPF